MDNFRIGRTGQAPLNFTGDLIASATSQDHDGPLQNRWHEITLYRTTGGHHVVAVEYHTCWQGEHHHQWAEVMADSAGIMPALLNYDPLFYLAGYPAGPAYAEKNARLRQELKLGYQRAISALMANTDFVEEVE